MTWQIAIFSFLALVLIVGGVWFERSRPSARIVAAVAALAALGVAGRLVLAPIPNVVATTDIVLITGFVLGGPPGFAVGALSALISNFWLGQGPWTPWQMAGWGMVGIGGALLAKLTNGNLGRIGFAIAGALAGLAYGALLDLSAMVSFGGEQSLERYLALSARGIPFNIAHAAGNAAIMFAAGPALVRIIERYRDRFDVEWEPLVKAGPSRPLPGAGEAARGGLAALLIALGLALPLLAGPAPRADAAEASASGGGSAASWLRSAQGDDGGYGIGPGYSSNAGMTGWAMLGLEATGINPLDVGGRSNPVAYLRDHIGDADSTGDLERTILALRGAGVSTSNFGGRNLRSELRSRQSGNGSYEKQVNLTAYAILARLAAGDGHSELGKSADWLRSVQQKDGGWASTAGGDERAGQHRRRAAGARDPGRRQARQAGSQLAAQAPEQGRRLVARAGLGLERAVDRLGAAGADRRRRLARLGEQGLAQRHRVPEGAQGHRRALRLLEQQRPDARLGHRPGAGRGRGRGVSDLAGRAKQQGRPQARWQRRRRLRGRIGRRHRHRRRDRHRGGHGHRDGYGQHGDGDREPGRQAVRRRQCRWHGRRGRQRRRHGGRRGRRARRSSTPQRRRSPVRRSTQLPATPPRAMTAASRRRS